MMQPSKNNEAFVPVALASQDNRLPNLVLPCDNIFVATKERTSANYFYILLASTEQEAESLLPTTPLKTWVFPFSLTYAHDYLNYLWPCTTISTLKTPYHKSAVLKPMTKCTQDDLHITMQHLLFHRFVANYISEGLYKRDGKGLTSELTVTEMLMQNSDRPDFMPQYTAPYAIRNGAINNKHPVRVVTLFNSPQQTCKITFE